MKSGKWGKRCLWALGMVLALGLIGVIAEKISRGSVMRPVRTLAGAVGVTISPPSLTNEEKKRTKAMVIEWCAACLEEYPILAVEAHPISPEENGFLQLYLLDESLGLSEELRDLLPMVSQGYDPAVAQRLLAEHQEAVSKIEHIASIPTQSSINMPDDFMGFIGLRGVKQAAEILLLKACLAADDGDAEQALHYIQLVGNMAQHLRDIETPFFLSETGTILIELARQQVVLDCILPKLGKEAELGVWLNELDAGAFDNQRLSEVIRGEWHAGGRHLAFPLIAQMDLSGELADGRSCAMAYAEWMAKQTRIHHHAGPFEITPEVDPEKEFEHLSHEQRDMMSLLYIGMDAWSKGYFRSAVVTARALAAIELLMLETSGETLTAESTQKVGKDPLNQKPFLFDPSTRQLSIAVNGISDGTEPVTLPW